MWNYFRAVFGSSPRWISILLMAVPFFLLIGLHEWLLVPVFGPTTATIITSVLTVGGLVTGFIAMVRSWRKADRLQQESQYVKSQLEAYHTREAQLKNKIRQLGGDEDDRQRFGR